MSKPKLLPARKDAKLPEDYDRYSYSGSLRLYQLGERCEAWKVTKTKQELMGVGWRTAGDCWGVFCTRVDPVYLVTVSPTLDEAADRFATLFG